MLNPRVHTPAGKSRFAPSSHTPRSLLPPPAPPRSADCDSSRVRVVARVRPFLPSEIERHGPFACVSFSKDHTEDTTLRIQDSTTSREGYYKMDSCYGEEDEISVIFAKEVEPLLPALFRGYNATVFAYGATGSGKTYTMQGLDNHPGLMPLAMTSILAMSERTNFRVEVAYYEVYMDRCYDLLKAKATEVSVWEGNDGRIQLRGLSQVHVKTLAEFREVFVNGCLRRRVGQTGINDASSRSHGVLMVTVASDDNNTIVGKLNLIDLAGNEDNRRTGNEGVRLAESARINQSLFALSNVISALNSNETRVPYRDSKLTRILRDSLGGTNRALMIACLNPRSYKEAAHTLSLATRSRQIMNQSADKKEDPQLKVDMEAKLQIWREAKGKVRSVLPSPGKAKPLFYTPSHHHINQMRRMERNLPQDTPKARRVLVLNQPADCGHEKEKGREVTHALSQQTKLPSAIEKELAYTLSLRTAISSGDQSNCTEQQKQVVGIPDCGKERAREEPSSHGLETDKENDCHVLAFTPCVKALNKSSSPPLSERLHNLRAAMREILQPISDNAPPEHKPSAVGIVKSLSPGFAQVKLSPLKSPNITPFHVSKFEDSTGTTPLEKLNKKSSGIKNSIAKEYLDFLNSASREELLELKGIGEKRAAYILNLREDSSEPLKEIEDLEKIGISKKQALSLFKDTARHILFS